MEAPSEYVREILSKSVNVTELTINFSAFRSLCQGRSYPDYQRDFENLAKRIQNFPKLEQVIVKNQRGGNFSESTWTHSVPYPEIVRFFDQGLGFRGELEWMPVVPIPDSIWGPVDYEYVKEFQCVWKADYGKGLEWKAEGFAALS